MGGRSALAICAGSLALALGVGAVLARLLGGVPTTSYEDGIRATIESLRAARVGARTG